MKKLLFALIVPILLLSVFAHAGANEQAIIDAGKRTLEQARSGNGVIVVDETHTLKVTTEKNQELSNLKDQSIMTSLSSIRSHAELYYSNNNNNFGPSTFSCSQGIFADSKSSGLKQYVSYLKRDSSSVACKATPTYWIATAKLTTGKYVCADSTGNLSTVSRSVKKNDKTCSKPVRPTKITQTMTSANTLELKPKSNNAYDLYFNTTATGVERVKKLTATLLLKDGVTYRLIEGEVASMINVKNLPPNSYIRFDEPTSMMNTYIGMSPEDITKTLELYLKDDWFTATLLASNSSEITYEVRTTVDKLSFKGSNVLNMKGIDVPKEAWDFISNSNSKDVYVTYTVVIRNGMIYSIKSKPNSVIKLPNGTDTYTFLARLSDGSVKQPVIGSTISCSELATRLGATAAEATSACGKYDKAAFEQTARQKGDDAAIQATISNMRAQAELYYSNTSDYGPNTMSCSQGMFGEGTPYGLKSLVDQVAQYSPGVSCTTGSSDANTKAQKWRVSAKLTDGTYWCVDSAGASQKWPTNKDISVVACE